jgi:hypothetical protein
MGGGGARWPCISFRRLLERVSQTDGREMGIVGGLELWRGGYSWFLVGVVDRWINFFFTFIRVTFILSLATLLTAATHHPESLRGLSRWTLAFIMDGPNAGFWKRRRRDQSEPSTPSTSSTPIRQNSVSAVGASQGVARKW